MRDVLGVSNIHAVVVKRAAVCWICSLLGLDEFVFWLGEAIETVD
jgi:hypothetical protein